MLHRYSSSLGMRQIQRNAMSKEQFRTKEIKFIPYASIVWSLLYAQACTKLNISFVVGMLGRYQNNR